MGAGRGAVPQELGAGNWAARLHCVPATAVDGKQQHGALCCFSRGAPILQE